MAHKASTQLRQSALSATAICTSLQFFHPAFSLSLSAVLLHVVLGLPRFRRPSGVQVNAVLWSLFGSFLMMWPMNFHLPPSHVLTEIFHLSHHQDFFACDSFLPAYLKYPSKTSALEDVDFVFITFIHLPRLAAIYQDWLYQCLTLVRSRIPLLL